MTALAHTGVVKIYWLPTVTVLAAPTVAQITAGTLIPKVTNYSFPSSESEVDVSDVDDIYDSSVVGTSKAGPITLTIKRDDTSETNTWDLFTFRANGFLLRTLNGLAIATSKVMVYPVQVGQKRPDGYGRNEAQKFEVSFYVTAPPNLSAVVAA